MTVCFSQEKYKIWQLLWEKKKKVKVKYKKRKFVKEQLISLSCSEKLMDSFHSHSQFTGHVVAIPYPGRGHINPMLNLCKLILKKRQSILISFILTEEWHGFISSAVSEPNIRYRVIPNNTIPSEIGRANDFQGFIAAVMSKMEGPVETLLGQLEPPAPCVIIFDAYLPWIVDLANRMNIPAASFWPMSATVFSIIRQHQALTVNGHFPFPPKQLGIRSLIFHFLPSI